MEQQRPERTALDLDTVDERGEENRSGIELRLGERAPNHETNRMGRPALSFAEAPPPMKRPTSCVALGTLLQFDANPFEKDVRVG